MNRQPLKRYAPAARQQFRRAITEKAALLGLSQNHNLPVEIKGDFAIVGTRAFPREFAAQREKLERWIARDGFAAVIDEVAYTWFNRLMAIRFMEINGYLGHGFLVLGHTDDRPEPQILLEAENVSLPSVDARKVTALKIAGDRDEELYRMLLLGQCHALHQAMPFLFEPISDESELLLPDALLPADSIVGKLVADVPTELWSEIEIIGWLYQFYISERKDEVIGKVVATPDIPAATQLFTPNWIVKYMTQNSLGRLWLEANPDSTLRAEMEYYIEPATSGTESVRASPADFPHPASFLVHPLPEGEGYLAAENSERSAPATPPGNSQISSRVTPPDNLLPPGEGGRGTRPGEGKTSAIPENHQPLELENIRLLDPACGSGHILVEAYDLFKAMYLERGYRVRDAARLILERNLWGLDIDARAAQMAGFALLMKARADDRRLLDDADNPPTLNLHALRDGSELDAAQLALALAPNANLLERRPLETDIAALLTATAGAQTFGSLLRTREIDAARLARLQLALDVAASNASLWMSAAREQLQPLLDQTQTLAQKYDCVVANPPYMGSKGMNPALKAFAAKQFPRSKSDLFAMFIERGLEFARAGGFCALITMQSWMFLSSYEELREWILEEKTLETMAHLGARAFAEISGEVVQTTTFVIRNAPNCGAKPTFVRAVEGDENEKARVLREGENRFDFFHQNGFDKIPGKPFIYWVKEHIFMLLSESLLLKETAAPMKGLVSLNDKLFFRQWSEVDYNNFETDSSNAEQALLTGKKWFPINKGGGYRRWYGNNEFCINWKNDGEELKESIVKFYGGGSYTKEIRNERNYFQSGITWGGITSSFPSFRYFPNGYLFSSGGSCAFPSENSNFILGFLNSSVALEILHLYSPTLNIVSGDIARLPYSPAEEILQSISTNAEEAISLSRTDWDSFETSWDFDCSPLLGGASLAAGFASWEAATAGRRARLRALETENNRLFIAAYGLEGELSPDVPDEQITLARADREADLKRLASYALGCLMGRYSLDESGLVYAGSGAQEFDTARYQSFAADADGIVPVTDIAWFAEDGATQLQRFLRAAYGESDYESNLGFWAAGLGGKSGETPDETLRRYLLGDFYKDHLRAYRKRPIYWQFSSGREKAFTALVYLHRMNAGTLSRLRSTYVLPLLSRYQARIDELARDVAAGAGAAARGAEKERVKRSKQLEELRRYDELLRHRADEKWEFDLDDGVKANYERFGELLGESKAITGA